VGAGIEEIEIENQIEGEEVAIEEDLHQIGMIDEEGVETTMKGRRLEVQVRKRLQSVYCISKAEIVKMATVAVFLMISLISSPEKPAAIGKKAVVSVVPNAPFSTLVNLGVDVDDALVLVLVLVGANDPLDDVALAPIRSEALVEELEVGKMKDERAGVLEKVVDEEATEKGIDPLAILRLLKLMNDTSGEHFWGFIRRMMTSSFDGKRFDSWKAQRATSTLLLGIVRL